MHYRKFVIEDYRAISTPVVVDLVKRPLSPVIGVNESGKTTILHAIFAFDSANDRLNDSRHLEDTRNLYSLESESKPARVSAEIGLTGSELVNLISKISSEALPSETSAEFLVLAKDYQGPVSVTRNLDTRRYSTNLGFTSDSEQDNALGQHILYQMPWILFFDDFRDSVEDRILIAKDKLGNSTGWLAIMERLFTLAGGGFSVHDIPEMEDRQRRTLLARVNRYLNNALTRAWQTFRIEETEFLNIEVSFEQDIDAEGATRNYLKLSIAERTADGAEYFFHIRDRSKGFFWFFNFVMKLEFNPKILNDEDAVTVYLLDEPGSYLHSGAQKRLCKKLVQLSFTNRVVYCTHSHYLLDPDTIRLSSIQIAEKDSRGSISLTTMQDYKGSLTERRSAFQPVLDALEIQQYSLEIGHGPVVVTEGIYDYYVLSLFKGKAEFTVLPATSADAIPYHVSHLIAWQLPFKVLWDNDDAGRKAMKRATKELGSSIADEHFVLLPLKGERAKKRIIQDLFSGDDVRMLKAELGLPKNAKFEKMILMLFDDPIRETLLEKVSEQTKSNMDEVMQLLAS